MRTFTYIIEKCNDTGYYIGSVPNLPGAHSQAATLDELNKNMREVIELVLDENNELESEYIGTQNIQVG